MDILSLILVLLNLALSTGAIDGANMYLVKLKDGISSRARAEHFGAITRENLEYRGRQPAPYPTGMRQFFVIATFSGYSGEFYDVHAEALRQNPLIEMVEEEHLLETHFAPSAGPRGVRRERRERRELVDWNLMRVSNRDYVPPGDATYYTRRGIKGKGMFAYVLDAGISDHDEFGGELGSSGRVERNGFNFNVVEGDDTDDTEGAGTGIAGVIAGVGFGMLSEATVVPVKIKTKSGDNSRAGHLLAGLHVVSWEVSNRKLLGRTVVVVGVTAGRSRIVDSAVDALRRQGVLLIAAAGNQRHGGELDSPASAESALTVGALAPDDKMWPQSNFGPRVDVFAPGALVQAAGIKSRVEIAWVEGTSVAAAHVAAIALYFMQLGGNINVPALVKQRIITLATEGKITDLPQGTPNRIAFNKGGEVFV